MSIKLSSRPNQTHILVVFIEIIPAALANVVHRTKIVFAVINIVNAATVWCFYPGITGQRLESIDLLFTKEDDH
jgi:hypothetical protein